MKQKHRFWHKNQSGFTLAELMVVLTIIGIIMGAVLANYAGTRSSRNLKLAQGGLVTNIRKIQSYTLSGRYAEVGKAVQYYIMKIDLSKPDRYFIQAIYDVPSGQPKVADLETIMLPKGIRFASSSPITITKETVPQTLTPTSCALIIFKLPFAKIYTAGVDAAGLPNNCDFGPGGGVLAGDIFDRILTYATTIENPFIHPDSKVILKLSDDQDTVAPKTVTVNAISNLITFD